MAHELESVEGKVCMAYSGEPGWHGLGTRVSNDLTPEEMMKAAGVDWKVRELKTYAEMKIQGKTTRIPTGMKALIRETDNKILTQVGSNWNPVQNADAFEFFSEFVSAGDMEMHTAGSLKGGKIVWALAKIDDNFELFGGDKVESYLLFSNPHMYGKTIDVKFTPIRVVCNNTLTFAISQQAKNQVKWNHRKQFDAEQVKKVLNIAKNKMSDYKKTAEILGAKVTTKDVMVKYFGELLGTSKKEGKDLSRNAERALELVSTQPGADFAKDSMWSVYNAVTYLVDHELGRNVDNRMTSAWFGQNAGLKQRALSKALEFADVV